ncbi:MAG TPA: DUF5302 domain-containing protein [Mycobacteriales bacterium]|nr:DUF5302 domain-containing protein [Mycobacteriales bacterium]
MSETSGASGPEQDARARFREALEKKKARGGAGSQPHDPGKVVVPGSNTKKQKTFRRKSGG